METLREIYDAAIVVDIHYAANRVFLEPCYASDRGWETRVLKARLVESWLLAGRPALVHDCVRSLSMAFAERSEFVSSQELDCMLLLRQEW